MNLRNLDIKLSEKKKIFCKKILERLNINDETGKEDENAEPPLKHIFKAADTLNVAAGTSIRIDSDATSGNIAYMRENRTIVGSIAPPADVTDFAINIVNDEAHLNWTAISDLDLAFLSSFKNLI